MMCGGYFAALDIGGTHARLALRIPGEQVRYIDAEGFTLLQNGAEDVKRRLAALFAEPLQDMGMTPEQCICLCCGAAGVDDEPSRRQYTQLFLELGFPVDKVQVYNDCELILAEYGRPALLVATGTGSLTMSRGTDGRMYRSGGWGYLTSDYGSACRIALDALARAVRAWDGVCAAPVLLELLKQAGIAAPLQAETFVRGCLSDKRKLAALTPLVCQAAALGDPQAAQVLQQQALLLGQDAVNAAKQANIERPMVLLWGSLLTQTDALRVPLMAYLESEIGAAELPVEKTALEAALLLAQKGNCA